MTRRTMDECAHCHLPFRASTTFNFAKDMRSLHAPMAEWVPPTIELCGVCAGEYMQEFNKALAKSQKGVRNGNRESQ